MTHRPFADMASPAVTIMLVVFISGLAVMAASTVIGMLPAATGSDVIADLHLPDKVPFSATLTDGRVVQGVTTPLKLACLSTYLRAHPDEQMKSNAVYMFTPRRDVVGPGAQVPVAELRLDPDLNSRLNALTVTSSDLSCPWHLKFLDGTITLNGD